MHASCVSVCIMTCSKGMGGIDGVGGCGKSSSGRGGSNNLTRLIEATNNFTEVLHPGIDNILGAQEKRSSEYTSYESLASLKGWVN